jgi:hypothetical protein
MGPIPKMLRVVLLVGCLDMAVAMAGEEACNGPYNGRTPTPEVECPRIVYTDLDTSFCKIHLPSTPRLRYSV